MGLWLDPLERYYVLIAPCEGSWLRAMDFELSLTPFLIVGRPMARESCKAPENQLSRHPYAR